MTQIKVVRIMKNYLLVNFDSDLKRKILHSDMLSVIKVTPKGHLEVKLMWQSQKLLL